MIACSVLQGEKSVEWLAKSEERKKCRHSLLCLTRQAGGGGQPSQPGPIASRLAGVQSIRQRTPAGQAGARLKKEGSSSQRLYGGRVAG